MPKELNVKEMVYSASFATFTAVLSYVTRMGIAIMVGSIPFLPGDILKSVTAVVIPARLNKEIIRYVRA